MNDQHISELLERAAQGVAVGPAPMAAVSAAAKKVRRRRALAATLASAAAVAAVVGGTAMLTGSDTEQPTPAATDPGEGMLFVGHGRAAIAVPQSWSVGEYTCGHPQRDSVVVDRRLPPQFGCPIQRRPPGVEEIQITPGAYQLELEATEAFTIDGVRAHRQKTACDLMDEETPICWGSVYIPTERVTFSVSSSTDRETVDRILERIQLVSGLTAVPVADRGVQGYLETLRVAGFVGEIEERKVPNVPAGRLLEVTPAPGTMLEPGAAVTLTVVAEPEGPADEVRVGANWGEDAATVQDEQIRDGATVELEVGERIWAFALGKRADTLAGVLNGESLRVTDWTGDPLAGKFSDSYPIWEAVAPGRGTITLTITADGERVELGTITVNVR